MKFTLTHIFLGSFLLLSSLANAQQSLCLALPSLKHKIDSLWQKVIMDKNLNPENTVSFCKQIIEYANQCPDHLADYLVGASAMASTRSGSLESWQLHLAQADSFLQQYHHLLSDTMDLRTRKLVQYETSRFNHSTGNLQQAIEGFETLWHSLPPTNKDFILDEYYNAIPIALNKIYLQQGNYAKANQWFALARQHTYKKHYLYEAVGFTLEGELFERQNQFQKAADGYRQAIALLAGSVQGRGSHHLMDAYVKLSELKLKTNDPDGALSILEEAKVYQDSSAWSSIYRNNQLSKVYLQLNDASLALQYGNQALDMLTNTYPDGHYWMGKVLMHIARGYGLDNQWELAIHHAQKAITYLSETYEEEDYKTNPNPSLSNTKLDLLKALIGKAQLLHDYGHAEPQNKIAILEASLATYETAVEMISILRANYDDDHTKVYLSEQSFSTFEESITLAADLYQATSDGDYLDRLLHITEHSKALTLLEQLQQIDAKKFVHIPDSLIQQETQFKFEIAQLERGVTRQRTPEGYRAYTDLLQQKRTAYDDLKNYFSATYPAYYQLKYQPIEIDINAVQEVLENDETLVTYFFGEQHIYLLSIAGAEVTFHTISHTDTLQEHLEKFREMVSDMNGMNGKNKIPEFYKHGYALYQNLIVPANINTKKVIIIPDGYLHYIPFEALPTTATGETRVPRKINYYLREHVVRLHFSASVFRHHQLNPPTIQPFEEDKLLVMAPGSSTTSFKIKDTLKPFINDQHRIQSITDRSQFRLWLDHGYEIILLFTHASAATPDPYFQLNNDTFYLSDLYGSRIQANLVLLAACETGIGINQKGEGILSIARGFAYQDVPHIIMSLWEVRNIETLRLSQDFLTYYLNPELDLDLSEALQKAKIAYLEDTGARGTPYLWSGLVCIGH